MIFKKTAACLAMMLMSAAALADDVVNDGRKKVGIYGAVDVADLVNDRAEPLVLPAQIGNLCFSI